MINSVITKIVVTWSKKGFYLHVPIMVKLEACKEEEGGGGGGGGGQITPLDFRHYTLKSTTKEVETNLINDGRRNYSWQAGAWT